jgi:hypothetical protein
MKNQKHSIKNHFCIKLWGQPPFGALLVILEANMWSGAPLVVRWPPCPGWLLVIGRLHGIGG